MLDRLFGGDTYTAVTRTLDAAALRQQVISHNLANANTPGFKRQEVQFENELSRAINQRDNPCAPRIHSITPKVITIGNTSERADGNNVNLETESISLAVNALKYEALSQSVAGTFKGLKTAIKGS
jgi:flagellar basal-body rod protein FlgB